MWWNVDGNIVEIGGLLNVENRLRDGQRSTSDSNVPTLKLCRHRNQEMQLKPCAARVYDRRVNE